MSYMWNDFNIKTFPAETVVYRNGVFCPELSTLQNTDISQHYKKPVHIIYVGEIDGENKLNINISASEQQVFLSVNIKNKKPAFFDIFIKNTGKNSELRGHVLLNNFDKLKYNCFANHENSNTGILVKNRLLAEKNSFSELNAVAKIDKNCDETVSDIGFSVLADTGAVIKMTPAQRISAIPTSANHSADTYRPNINQIEYLRSAGLSGAEVNNAMRDAFINGFDLF